MIENYFERHSVRSFQDRAIEPEKLAALRRAINNCPTSINGQCCSVIFVQDNVRKAKYGKLNWKQPHFAQAPLFMVFLADFRRVMCAGEHAKQGVTGWTDTIEAYSVGLVDATIAATSASNAAWDLGLGSCFIGGVRGFTEVLVADLQLPAYVFPVVGILVGYEKELPTPKIKPKVNRIYDEQYDATQFDRELAAYNVLSKDYYQQRLEKDLETVPDNSYYKNTARTLGVMIRTEFYKTYLPTLRKQGFLKKYNL